MATLFTTACSEQPKLEPLGTEASILAFGDSLTYGTGAAPDKSYPARLQQLSGHTVINAGKPGETSEQGLRRLPSLIERYQPELIVICHGGNDILQKKLLRDTRANIQQMIDLARENGIQVVLVSIPRFGVLNLEPAPFYIELAEYNHMPLVKGVLSDILSKNRLKSDRVHPNADGYERMAEGIYQVLSETGAI